MNPAPKLFGRMSGSNTSGELGGEGGRIELLHFKKSQRFYYCHPQENRLNFVTNSNVGEGLAETEMTKRSDAAIEVYTTVRGRL